MKSLMLSAGVLVLTTVAGTASTVSIDSAALADSGAAGGFTLVGGGVQNSSNCPAERPCIRINPNELVTLEFGGNIFTLESLLFSLQGNNAELTITPFTLAADGVTAVAGAPFVSETFIGSNVGLDTNDPDDGNGPLGSAFFDIVRAEFDNSGTGTVRIGGLTGSGQGPMPPEPPVDVVPLPAGAWLLLTGLLAVVGLKRRKELVA